MGRIIFQRTKPTGKRVFSLKAMIRNTLNFVRNQGMIEIEPDAVIDAVYVDFENAKLTKERPVPDENGDITMSTSV